MKGAFPEGTRREAVAEVVEVICRRRLLATEACHGTYPRSGTPLESSFYIVVRGLDRAGPVKPYAHPAFRGGPYACRADAEAALRGLLEGGAPCEDATAAPAADTWRANVERLLEATRRYFAAPLPAAAQAEHAWLEQPAAENAARYVPPAPRRTSRRSALRRPTAM